VETLGRMATRSLHRAKLHAMSNVGVEDLRDTYAVSGRLAMVVVAVSLVAGPAWGAVVPPPSAPTAGSGETVFTMADGAEPSEPSSEPAGLAEATRAAPLPAGITAVGAALLGLGLVCRRRG
jgi:hypothetical protein